MSIFLNEGQTAWEIYWKAIENLMGGDSNYTVVQPLAIASRVEFDSGYPKHNLYLKNSLGNRIPTWGALYRNTAGLTVSDEYLAFMDRINEAVVGDQSGEEQRRLREIDNQRKDIRTRRNALRREIKVAWDDYCFVTPANSQMSYAMWLQEEGWETELGILTRELESINGRYIVVFNNTGGVVAEIGRATAALEASTSKYRLPATTDEENQPPESWSEFYKTAIQVDIQRFKQDRVETTIQVSEEQHRSSNISKWWGGGGSVSYGWFGFGGGFGGTSNHSQVIRNTESHTLSLKINFKNVSSFPIVREPWFKEGLIRQYASKLPRSFWEANGRLNLIPTSVLLAHGLSIDVKTDDETRDYYYESHRTSGRAGFRIGPWSFGGSGGSTSTTENTSVEKTETGFKVSDTSGRAVVLAVSSFRPLDLLPAPEPFRSLNVDTGNFINVDLLQDTKEREDDAMRSVFKQFESELIEYGDMK